MKIVQWIPGTVLLGVYEELCVCDDGNVYKRSFTYETGQSSWTLYAEPPVEKVEEKKNDSCDCPLYSYCPKCV